MPNRMKLAALAVPVVFIGLLAGANMPRIERWPWSTPPGQALKAAKAQLERLEARLKFERDVAKRAEDNADRTREALAHVRKHRYPVAVMLEWDASVTRAEQVAMAKREIVSESEAEREDLMAEIRRLEDVVAQEPK